MISPEIMVMHYDSVTPGGAGGVVTASYPGVLGSRFDPHSTYMNTTSDFPT